MRISKWLEFIGESISGWEIVGQHMGPGYPEQKLPVFLSTSDTEVLMGIDGEFYTYDNYQELYNNYLKLSGEILTGGFSKENLDIILSF